MYISYNWLKGLVKLPAKTSPEEIATELTDRTVEVEGLAKQADRFNNVVVGKVLEVNKHPNADRLRVTKVDIKKEKLTIVCGAPNVAVGQMVPVALIGATLPNGLEIKEAEIRGEKSYGMICAEDELGLGKSHEGILILKDGAKAGESFAKYLKADDIIFEVDNKSLSNRPDLWSHYGLARELSAIFSLSLKPYSKLVGNFEFPNQKGMELDVKVEDKELCQRYQAVKIDNIKIAGSPDWLKEKLVAVGQKPINNIVDLTNYVMLEIGQPLHAFDADKVKKIVVRRAAIGEAIETLDGKERQLDNNDLVIADGKKAIAIAGVMGGRNSEIDDKTTAIILEAANFQGVSVRKTSQKLSLRSESSIRFEKSLDPLLTETALLRFLTLLQEICPEARIASSLTDINNFNCDLKKISLSLTWLNEKIGQEIPKEKVIGILEKLGFKVKSKKEELEITVPSWRAAKDVQEKEDIVEEVLRLYGYDNISSRLPVQSLVRPEVNQNRFWERRIKTILSLKYSLVEVYNYSFIGEDQLKKTGLDFSGYLRIANPLTEGQALLRQSLVPGLISNIKSNQARYDNLRFFESGSVFFDFPGNLKKDASSLDTLPYQEKHLGIVLASDAPDQLEELKGIINNLFQILFGYRIETEFSRLERQPGWADEKSSARISVSGHDLGLVAKVNNSVAKNINLKKNVVAAEINFSSLIDLLIGYPGHIFQEAPKYPALTRDLAFVVEDKILYNDLKNEMINFHPLIRSVELFDVYVGSKLPSNQKSLAFHLNYQSDEETLTAAAVDKIQASLIKRLEEKFEAKLRDF